MQLRNLVLVLLLSFRIAPALHGQCSFVPRDANYSYKDVCIITGSANETFIGCDSGYVLYSANNMVTIHEGRLPNHQNEVKSLAWHDQYQSLYAATYGSAGLYRSHDKGATWQAMPVPDTLVRSVCVGPDQRIFIGTGFPRKVYVSADSGFTWTQVQMPVTFSPASISRSVASGKMFIGCLSGNYFVMSGDSGQTWDSIGSFPSNAGIQSIWQLRNSDTLFATNNTTLYLSGDNGVTWTAEEYFSYAPEVTLLTQSGLFIAKDYNYFHYCTYSASSSPSWQLMNANTTVMPSMHSIANDSFLLCGAQRGDFMLLYSLPSLAISSVEGVGIHQTSSSTSNARIFAFTGDSVIFAGIHDISNSVEKFYRSADDGLNWEEIPDIDVSSQCPYAMVRYPSGYLVTAMKSSGSFGAICSSADDGISWDSSNVHFAVNDLILMPDLSLRALAANKIYTCSDSGRTWSLLYTFPSFIPAHLAVNNSDGMLFAYGGGNNYYSTDGGASWVTSPVLASSDVGGYNQLTGTLFFFPANGGVKTSFDDGVSWQYNVAGLPTSPGIYATCFYSSACGNLFVQFHGVNVSQADQYISYDDGLTWTPAGCSRFDLAQVGINSHNKMFGAVTGAFPLYRICESANPFNAIQNCKTIWPGDVNNDLGVDVVDMLDLGISFNQTGPARALQGINWNPHISSDWNVLQPNGNDMRYADCDGNGVTDFNDTLAIFQNYGQQHSARYGNTMNVQSGIPVHLINTTGNDTVAPGTLLTFDLVIGDNNIPVTGFYGAGWKFRMDTAAILPVTFQTMFNLPYTSSTYLRLKKNISAQQADGALVRNDQQDTSGILTIAQFGVVSDSMLATINAFTLQSLFFTLIDTIGNELAFSFSADTVYIDPAISGVQQIDSKTGSVSVFPVPCSDQLNLLITSGSTQELTIRIMDIEGRMVLTKKQGVKAGRNILRLDEYIAMLAPGSYLIYVNGNNFSSAEKIIKIGE